MGKVQTVGRETALSKDKAKPADHRNDINAQGWPPVVDQIIEFITTGIKTGRFSPGQKLIEGDICTRLGVKRGPVRDSFRILAGQGVLDLVPNRGAWIRKLSRAELCEMIQALAALNAGSLNLAVKRNSPAKLEETLKPIIQSIEQACSHENYNLVLAEIERYHGAIQKLGHNSYMEYLWSRLNIEHYHRSLAIELEVINWQGYFAAYEKAHRAIIAGDAAAAAAAFEQHADRLITALESESASPVFA